MSKHASVFQQHQKVSSNMFILLNSKILIKSIFNSEVCIKTLYIYKICKSVYCYKNLLFIYFPARNVTYTVELDAQNEIKRGFFLDNNNARSSQRTEILTDVGSTQKCSDSFNIFLKVGSWITQISNVNDNLFGY